MTPKTALTDAEAAIVRNLLIMAQSFQDKHPSPAGKMILDAGAKLLSDMGKLAPPTDDRLDTLLASICRKHAVAEDGQLVDRQGGKVWAGSSGCPLRHLPLEQTIGRTIKP